MRRKTLSRALNRNANVSGARNAGEGPLLRTEDQRIGAEEADELLAPLGRFATLVLAVSGGPDSLALLHLAAGWLKRRGAASPKVFVATVDHGLRPRSKDEAADVARQALALGLPHRTLIWSGPKPASGLQNAARQARYELLAAYTNQVAGCGRAAVVTAHHLDDQSETFVMRLARGAGVDGLAAMAPARRLAPGSDIMLLRPLLSLAKARLVATLAALEIAWAEDPTNHDLAFERVRARRLVARLAEEGVTGSMMALSARRLNEAREALDYAEKQFLGSLALSFNDGIFASFARRAFDAGPVLLRQRGLARLLAQFGGASPAPQLSEVETLARRLEAEQNLRTTLGGAIVTAGAKTVRIWREYGRMDQDGMTLQPGDRALWDQRFWISATPNLAGPVIVRPLGPAGIVAISARLAGNQRRPARAVATLASFWANDTLMAVPTLGLHGTEGSGPDCAILPVVTAIPATSISDFLESAVPDGATGTTVAKD